MDASVMSVDCARPDLFAGRGAAGAGAAGAGAAAGGAGEPAGGAGEPAGGAGERAAAARVIAAADAARRRIERDLHDGLQQRLVSLLLRAAVAETAVPADRPALKADLARIADGLADAVQAVREIARGIHPAILSDGGLGPAVRALARSSPVPVTLDARLPGRLPGPVEAAAYYIACEALANAAKHARARTIRLTLRHHPHTLTLTIRDDGTGGADPAGPGLTGLADRVHALAGTLQLDSPPGHGTRLHVTLPTRPQPPH